MNNYYCEDCGEKRPDEHAIKKYCEKHLKEHTPMNHESWKERFDEEFKYLGEDEYDLNRKGIKDFIQKIIITTRLAVIEAAQKEIEGMYQLCPMCGVIKNLRTHLDYPDHDSGKIVYNLAISEVSALLEQIKKQ